MNDLYKTVCKRILSNNIIDYLYKVKYDMSSIQLFSLYWYKYSNNPCMMQKFVDLSKDILNSSDWYEINKYVHNLFDIVYESINYCDKNKKIYYSLVKTNSEEDEIYKTSMFKDAVLYLLDNNISETIDIISEIETEEKVPVSIFGYRFDTNIREIIFFNSYIDNIDNECDKISDELSNLNTFIYDNYLIFKRIPIPYKIGDEVNIKNYGKMILIHYDDIKIVNGNKDDSNLSCYVAENLNPDDVLEISILDIID